MAVPPPTTTPHIMLPSPLIMTLSNTTGRSILLDTSWEISQTSQLISTTTDHQIKSTLPIPKHKKKRYSLQDIGYKRSSISHFQHFLESSFGLFPSFFLVRFLFLG